jgi:hypothetical protein
MMNETLIYKYPNVKQIFNDNFTNSIYFNPYADHINNETMNINKYKLSCNSSNKAVEIMMKNLRFVHVNGLAFNNNHKIFPLLEKTIHLFEPITWNLMANSRNPAILSFLEKHPDKISWDALSDNSCPEAIRILENNQDKINWKHLSTNAGAFDILYANQDKIEWSAFCDNHNPKAIEMIEQMLIEDPSKINFEILSGNHNAIHIISQHLDKVQLSNLSRNPNAMNILMQHPELIEFNSLLSNPNAISYLETQMMELSIDDICNLAYKNANGIQLIEKMLVAGLIPNDNIINIINLITCKESIYQLDYQAMSKVRVNHFYTELMEKALHPSRVKKWLDYHCENGGEIDGFFELYF